jgi:hypothetical protein
LCKTYPVKGPDICFLNNSKLKSTKMKKLTLSLMAVLMVLAFMPTHLQAATEKGKVTVAAANTVVSAEAKVLITRLDEIKAMDLSKMSSVEKRQLRHEVRSIKATLNQMDGGIIYISAGGLLLILLLLILLL